MNYQEIEGELYETSDGQGVVYYPDTGEIQNVSLVYVEPEPPPVTIYLERPQQQYLPAIYQGWDATPTTGSLRSSSGSMKTVGGLIVVVILVMAFVSSVTQHTGSGTSVSLPGSVAPQPSNAKPAAVVLASQRLVRLDQNVCDSQYASASECATWSPSACSAASMTEVMDAWGKHLRIMDTIKVESGIGEITPDAGLSEAAGIGKTVAQFGFQDQFSSSLTLSQVEAYGNAGYPVIVGFPPNLWAGGHLLVVLGSHTTGGVRYVHLADSSSYNMQYMTESKFTGYWGGNTDIVTPQGVTPSTSAPRAVAPARPAAPVRSGGAYSVVGSPTITADFINRVMSAYNSPAAGTGQALYDEGVKYRIDPVFALAFFLHESTMGTAGEARQSLSLGNLRCIPNALCQGGYAWFSSWQDGYDAWYALIKNLYVGQWGLTTVDTIIPKYAPSSDGNNEAAYISEVKHSIDTWHSGALTVA